MGVTIVQYRCAIGLLKNKLNKSSKKVCENNQVYSQKCVKNKFFFPIIFTMFIVIASMTLGQDLAKVKDDSHKKSKIY